MNRTDTKQIASELEDAVPGVSCQMVDTGMEVLLHCEDSQEGYLLDPGMGPNEQSWGDLLDHLRSCEEDVYETFCNRTRDALVTSDQMIHRALNVSDVRVTIYH